MNLLFSEPLMFVIVLIAIIIALSFHEFAHAYVGYKLGDLTAEKMGRLTLNPLAHIDWVGLLLLVLVGFGWGKPVPYNPHNLKAKKWGPTIIAVSGPGSNLLLALVATGIFWLLGSLGALEASSALVFFLGFSVIINLALMFFNLIPIPPLDGSKLLMLALDKPKYAQLRYWLQTRGVWVFLAVVFIDAIFNIGLFAWLFKLVTLLASWMLGGNMFF